MDFVQRNLINERNNLQVELAKAKLLIAELSEAATLLRGMEAAKRKSEMSGKKLPTEEEASKALKALQIKKEERANEASSGMGTRIKRPGAFKRKFNEEAEYISDLENVIISIAESMNVSVEELMEFNSPRNLQRLANMARAVSPDHPTGLIPLGRGIAPAENAGQRIGAMLTKSGVPGAQGGAHGIQVAARDPMNDGHFNGYKDVGPNTPIEFNHPNMHPKVKADAGDQVRRLSKVGIDQRAAAKERQSRTF
jgi:hypothetical protein